MKNSINNENDWTRTATSLNVVREKLIIGTHIEYNSDSVTVLTNIWVETVIELMRIQRQCAAYSQYIKENLNEKDA